MYVSGKYHRWVLAMADEEVVQGPPEHIKVLMRLADISCHFDADQWHWNVYISSYYLPPYSNVPGHSATEQQWLTAIQQQLKQREEFNAGRIHEPTGATGGG